MSEVVDRPPLAVGDVVTVHLPGNEPEARPGTVVEIHGICAFIAFEAPPEPTLLVAQPTKQAFSIATGKRWADQSNHPWRFERG